MINSCAQFSKKEYGIVVDIYELFYKFCFFYFDMSLNKSKSFNVAYFQFQLP